MDARKHAAMHAHTDFEKVRPCRHLAHWEPTQTRSFEVLAPRMNMLTRAVPRTPQAKPIYFEVTEYTEADEPDCDLEPEEAEPEEPAPWVARRLGEARSSNGSDASSFTSLASSRPSRDLELELEELGFDETEAGDFVSWPMLPPSLPT